jgi:uncharacterized protein GlcG (DUF336 family)
VPDLALARAQALVQRAVDKAEQLGLRGGIAVVGASGALITASRLDQGGHGGMARAASKAWISATQQIPSTEHLHRMTTLPTPISAGFVAVSPQAVFPGAGGMPVRDSAGTVVAGIAASGATVSPFLPRGVRPEVVSADGEPANPEDLLIAYALGIPYVGQHGDDTARWRERFGDLVVAAGSSLGMKPAPTASRQPELLWARDLCGRVRSLAAEGGRRVAVAVVDPGGDPIQQDRMDGAVTGGVEVALACAATAARYGLPSGQVPAAFAGLHPAAFLAAPGGVPLLSQGIVIGALGVGGVEADVAGELAQRVIGP